MKIELLTTRADFRRRQEIGDIIDVPADEAIRMIRLGQAKAVGSEEIETAILTPREVATPRPAANTKRRPRS